VRVPDAVVEVILDHARGCVPHECCGLLLGAGTTVQKAWPARNELASETRYRVDPRDYVAAAGYGRRHGLDVIGAYHSHPTSPAQPSPTDIAESAGASFIYLIAGRVSLPGEPEVRAFRLADGNFTELPIVVDTQENQP
jgi:proteasome lid subunit RPN8/RPN11